MSTMKEMAKEYRVAAAKIALRLKECEAAGAEENVLQSLRASLRNIRESQRLLDSYYEVPREESITLSGFIARKGYEHDH